MSLELFTMYVGTAGSDSFGVDTIVTLFKWILDPRSWALIATVSGAVTFTMKKINKAMYVKIDEHIRETENRQDLHITKLEESVSTFEKMFTEYKNENELTFLRIQIIMGVQTRALTIPEILHLYDQYTEKGGNSYVSRIVDKYIAEKEKEIIDEN